MNRERERRLRLPCQAAFGSKTRALRLKKYGMFVADNGQDWLMSISPDARLKGLETLKRVKGSDFEVVETGARSGSERPAK